MTSCELPPIHPARRIVLTGGPGAGKTAVLETLRKTLCHHVQVLPESAGIVFGGGFPRRSELEGRRAAQRAIFYVQRELEAAVITDDVSIALCDRGTIDSLAYWPGPDDFFAAVGTTLEEQLAHYHAVIHLRTPRDTNGYNRQNPLRIETAAEAAAIDERIAQAWARHPRRFEVASTADFLEKVEHAIEIVRGEMPSCCRLACVRLPARRQPGAALGGAPPAAGA
jgi:predicted ATPase